MFHLTVGIIILEVPEGINPEDVYNLYRGGVRLPVVVDYQPICFYLIGYLLCMFAIQVFTGFLCTPVIANSGIHSGSTFLCCGSLPTVKYICFVICYVVPGA